MPSSRHLRHLTGHRLFIPWFTLLALAVALTALVELDALPDESALIRDIQDWRFPGESLSDAVRDLTTTSFVLVLAVLMAIAHRLEGDSRAAMVLIVLLLALVAVQAGLKELVDRPRPSEASACVEVRATQTSPSFPAGHVMGPTVVYGWAIVTLGRVRTRGSTRMGGARSGAMKAAGALLAIVAATLLLLTGIVNVYLGVHWPSDVLGGYLWGVVLLLPGLIALEWQSTSAETDLGTGLS